jgi:hypothetical protein
MSDPNLKIMGGDVTKQAGVCVCVCVCVSFDTY